MKTKAKLILAMSVLAAGVAAAGATGTFAWFQTNRTASLTYSQVTAQKTAGSLQAWVISANDGHTGWNAENTSTTTTNVTSMKMSDVSSQDGVTFAKPLWEGSTVGEGQPISKIEDGKPWIDYTVFVIGVKNPSGNPIDVYLDEGTKVSAVTSSTADEKARDYTRFAINKAGSTIPTWNTFSASETKLFDTGVGTTGKYLPKTASDGTPSDISTSINYWKTDLTKAASATINSTETEVAKAIKKQRLVRNLAAGATTYFTVSVWLEGTKDSSDTFQNAEGGSISLAIKLAAFDTDSVAE